MGSGRFRISNFEFRISAHPPGSRDGCPTKAAEFGRNRFLERLELFKL